MTNWIDLTNFGIASGGLIVAVMGLFLTYTAPYMEKYSRIFFKIFFSLIICYVTSDLLSQVSLEILGAEYVILSRMGVFLESFFSALLMPLLTTYLLFQSNENPLKKCIFYISLGLFFIYLTLLIITQFSQRIYYITDDNVYHRGTLYPLLLVPPAILMLINLIAVILRAKNLSKRQRQAFFINVLLPLICMLIQMKSYGLLLIVIGTSFASLLMFFFILSDQIDQYIHEREEKLEAQTNVKMLQMRPHFIYNTMTSIYYLCEQDPQKAMKTINDFTNYLRRSFSSIAKKEPIPFMEELSHVHAYLDIEKTRFEDKLFVEFDTPNTSFRIPPLTLQPIVENSVKYGIDPELDPLHISVSTRETDKGNEIIVSDTGPGFNEINAEDNREPHIALNNIRERLAMMCNGTLSIEPREGGGTVVRIFIPF